MLGIFIRTCGSLLLFGAGFITGSPSIVPSLEFATNYETHVQLTIKNGDETTILSVEEYHNLEDKAGRVDFVVGGAREKHYYFLKTNLTATFTGLNCTSNPLSKFLNEFGFADMGMYERPDGIIGPSAYLWSSPILVSSDGEAEDVRGITCQKYSHLALNVTYYISSPQWKSVHGVEEQVPVRIQYGTSTFDFTFFEVNVSHPVHDPYLIPLHIGCFGLMVTPEGGVQKLDPHFLLPIIYYADEVTDQFALEEKAEALIALEKTWIDQRQRLVKIDAIDKNYHFHSTILDFNTGIMYDVDHSGKCTIKPIANEPMFEKKYKGSTGQMKEAKEIFWLNRDYQYLGQTLHRNIHCNVFESIEQDYTHDDGKLYKKMVFTYFVMTPEYKSAGSKSDDQLLVALDMTGSTNLTKEPDFRVERDFFDFRTRESYPRNEDMNIEQCFRDESQKQYFSIYFTVTDETHDLISKMNRIRLLSHIKELTIDVARISALRLPYSNMYLDQENMIFVGQMLNTLPVSARYSNKEVSGPNEGQTKIDLKDKDLDDCDAKCDSTCRGFTLCDKECYLTPKEMKEDSPITKKTGCMKFEKAVIDAKEKEPSLEAALENLRKRVDDKKFSVKIGDKEVTARNIDKNIHPFNVERHNKKYEIVYSNRRLVVNWHVIWEISGLRNEEECYRQCVSSDYLACTSFSYCSSSNMCIIGAISMRNLSQDSLKSLTLKEDSCNIFRRRALEVFSESPGLVPLSKGNKVFQDVAGPDGCAIKCTEENEFFCEGFEICADQCVLHKEHILDVKGTSDTGSPLCSHYYLNYSLILDTYDDLVMGSTIIRFQDISLDQCAKMCFDPKLQPCRSVNYCPADNRVSRRSSCEVNTKLFTDDGVTTIPSDVCANYMKKIQDDDTTKPTQPTGKTLSTEDTSEKPSKDTATTGDTGKTTSQTLIKEVHVRQGVEKSAFTGAVIGMLIFGIVAGALGFLGYSYYRSRRNDNGISVRFTRQT